MSDVIFQNVVKKYEQNTVLENFSLKIEDGQFCSFLGPSGCGKTTCLRMVAGLENLSEGEISIGGNIVSSSKNSIFVPPEKRNLGMVFQSYAVWPHLNVFENVAFPLKVKKMAKEEIQKRVNQVLEIVELSGLGARMPNQLSGGQQQRVALARGLVARPQVLLLDEPLSNLDAKLREKMRHDIRQIQNEFKLTCIYVTHDQVEAFTMSDIIVVINKGVIEQAGTPEEIRSHPKTPFVKQFIS